MRFSACRAALTAAVLLCIAGPAHAITVKIAWETDLTDSFGSDFGTTSGSFTYNTVSQEVLDAVITSTRPDPAAPGETVVFNLSDPGTSSSQSFPVAGGQRFSFTTSRTGPTSGLGIFLYGIEFADVIGSDGSLPALTYLCDCAFKGGLREPADYDDVTITLTEIPMVGTSVPLPAGIWFLAGAIGGLGMIRRRPQSEI